jgi:fructose-1,6-bisphosphatase/inositol monophosphatase family enzyme
VLLDQLLDVAVDAADGAAAILRQGFGQARQEVQTKSSPTDMVSEMDRAAEAYIDRVLAERRPGDAVLGEEGTNRPGSTGVQWIVDPLDGTTNYLFGVPAYGVSVAAEVDGEPAVGVVIDPSRTETWTAVTGRGAKLNGRTVGVLARPGPLDQALIVTGFSYSREQRGRQASLIGRVLPRVRDIRRFGAAALDLCWVAGGRVSGYYEWGLQPWDLAAGLLIATEGGARTGKLSDGTVVCAPPDLFGPLCELLEAGGGAV